MLIQCFSRIILVTFLSDYLERILIRHSNSISKVTKFPSFQVTSSFAPKYKLMIHINGVILLQSQNSITLQESYMHKERNGNYAQCSYPVKFSDLSISRDAEGKREHSMPIRYRAVVLSSR